MKIKCVMRDKKLNKVPALKKWCRQCTEHMRRVIDKEVVHDFTLAFFQQVANIEQHKKRESAEGKELSKYIRSMFCGVNN